MGFDFALARVKRCVTPLCPFTCLAASFFSGDSTKGDGLTRHLYLNFILTGIGLIWD
jgi:hypothetical protein